MSGKIHWNGCGWRYPRLHGNPGRLIACQAPNERRGRHPDEAKLASRKIVTCEPLFFKIILYFDNPNPTKRAARPALGLRLAPPVAVQEVAYASASNRNKY